MFFGYPRYLDAKLSESLPGVFRRPLANVTRPWSSRFAKGLEMEAGARYATWTSFLDPDVRKRLLPDIRFREQSPEQQMLELLRSGKGSALDRIFRFDLVRYIPCDLLQLYDNMTMAHSLEARMPFCDVDLVDEIARTPAAIRFHGYRLRPMLRDMAKKYLPEKVVKRTKRESMIPIGRWFCNELRDYVESQFTRNRLPAIVDFASVQSMWEEHKSGRADHGHVLWAVLLLGHWLRKISGKHRLIAG
jgi:asparagine synthase (glutamine-hydrolysing)